MARYTPTLKLSTRLVAFVTMIVISATFILFIGGALSFKRIGQEYIHQSLAGIAEVVDKEMEDPDAAYSMQRWIPKMLQASNIVEMRLSSEAGVIYRYKNTSSRADKHLLMEKEFDLERNPGYVIVFTVMPPYLGYSYSIGAMWSITLAFGLITFCLVRGVGWLKLQLYGSELLEERGRMILAGRVEQYARGHEQEWPYTASEALDKLIAELQDARQERSRFDTFIRSQTFLDKVTGNANRILFDSKLDSTLNESGSRGGVLMLRIDDWDALKESNDKSSVDHFVVQIAESLSAIIQRYPDAMLSRYYSSDFALLIPHQGSKELATIANSCIKQLEKLTPLSPLDPDDWCHIGVTMYQEGEHPSRIIGETETAVKSAQLQRASGWSNFEKQAVESSDRGSVRWRTLLDEALQPEKLILYTQPCYQLKADNQKSLIHNEVFIRLNDPEKGELKASRFGLAVESVGYEARVDKATLIRVLKELEAGRLQGNISVNMYVKPFSDKVYLRWFRDELLQLTTSMRQRLSFEFVEGQLVEHLDYMRPVIRMLTGLGCKVVVGQAGRTIVSTYYLKDLNISYLKLHRSLIKRIDQRHENQLFIRSMLGACESKDAIVVGVGVETKAEVKTLRDLGVSGVQGRLYQSEAPLLIAKKNSNKIKQSDDMSQVIKPGRRNRWKKK
ncbi:RNase E specificity factor CsrD [Vibrio astriarenae]|uniref:RNase E specificity factor CsrD n=1 Tax=Vibrio astriarenae TaxID=1481923 RepID=A0A7Z2T4X8_9VIBR|nr:RNase E specificity factor CsrD [Vibrio astriarenae]QIA64316.1 RNase E specificity factor CsrD [Vibrio astriarenae]